MSNVKTVSYTHLDVYKRQVFVGGEDVRKYDIEQLRNNVAMVLQKNEMCIRDSTISIYFKFLNTICYDFLSASF